MSPELGIIEGYFGRAWSWAARAAVLDTLASSGFSFFHYAPKADAKLRRCWREPFDKMELEALASFSGDCRSRGVRFGVGLTPFEAHLDFGPDLRRDIRAKLQQLGVIGIDDLVIMFDDMRGDLPDLAERQGEIVAECLAAGVATRFFVTPSYYSDDPVLDRAFGARPARYLADLGRALDPAIFVYWTGEEVCSRGISPGHLKRVAEDLGRKVALWDNYPVNDGPRMSQFLHLRGFTGRPAALAGHLSHHAINPLSQPLLGCIPALTLPQVYQRCEDYSYLQAFREAAAAVVGADLTSLLAEDLALLQDTGLAKMTTETSARLRQRYSAFSHPAACEIVAWLDGDYAVTGEVIRTQ